ncbi:MAG: hypothetical protein QM783_12050 [Phycisphaerales bacterium]
MTTRTVEPPLATNVDPTPALQPPASGPKRRRLRVGRIIACGLLGALTTLGLSIASAVLLPFMRPNPLGSSLQSGTIMIQGAYPTLATATTFGERVQYWMAARETIEVAVFGDHLAPWHLRISSPFASRLVWFEKGRVYNKSGGKAPASASSAAVSCWSFATSCWSATGSKLTGPLPEPSELTRSNKSGHTWATAIEERGWPFRAFTCRISAPMDDPTAPTYVVEDGIWADRTDPAAMSARGGEPIQSVRAVPTRPLWPGLAADTLIWGALFYALSFMPGAIVRALRGKRNGCPVCGYNLKGQPVPGCPECGWNRSLAKPADRAEDAPIADTPPSDREPS